MLYVITFRCSSSPCSSFIAFCPLLRPTEHIARPIPTPFCFCPHATRQTRLSASGLPTDAYRYATPIFISHALRETYTQFRRKSPYTPAFAADTAARHPVLPLSTPSIPASGAGGAHFFTFSFHVEHASCRPPKPQRLSRFLLVYAYLYIASLHVFRLCVCFFRPCDPFPVVAPRLSIAPRRRSAAFVSEPRIAARLAVFVGARLHSVFRGRTPSFLISRSLFASCPMAHRNLFVCFSLLPAFRAFPSMIRSASSPVFD